MYKRADFWLTKIINLIMVSMLFIASVVMFSNVILRYLFQSGLHGAFELVSLLIVSVTFIGASQLIADNEHLTMDAIVTILPKTIKRVFEIVVCIVGIVFSIVLFVYSLKVMDTLGGGKTSVLQLPSYVPFIPIAIGSLLTILKYIYRIFEQLKGTEDNQ